MSEYDLNDGIYLVKIARNAIFEFLKSKRKLEIPKSVPSKFFEKRGVFVTLNSIKNGNIELRGCIGRPYPDFPLIKATIDSAIDAAVNDPRFESVSLSELDHIIVEISILTKPELIKVNNPLEYLSEINIGEDGLIISHGWLKGLLLPQVPVEWNWDVQEFLDHLCMKAGMYYNCWKDKNVEIYKFNAIIYGEIEPNGKIIENPHLYYKETKL